MKSCFWFGGLLLLSCYQLQAEATVQWHCAERPMSRAVLDSVDVEFIDLLDYYSETTPIPLPDCYSEPKFTSRPASLLWTDEDWNGSYGAIADDVAISGNGLTTFVAWNLNRERFSLYETSGAGQPGWEFDALEGGAYNIDGNLRCALSRDGSVVVGTISYRQTVPETFPSSHLFSFDAETGAVLWHFAFPTTEDGLQTSEYASYLEVSADGSTIVALGGNTAPEPYHLYVFDSANQTPIYTLTLDHAEFQDSCGLALTANGQTAVIELRAEGQDSHKTRIYDLTTGTLQQQIITRLSPTQCAPAVSADGRYLAIGDLHGKLIVFELQAGTGLYEELWRFSVPVGHYYPWVESIALSDDGGMLVMTSYEPDETTSKGYGYLFSIDSNTPLIKTADACDACPCSAMAANGAVAVVGSWGDYDGQQGFKLQVLDCSALEVIYELGPTTPGSILACDIDDAGTYAVAGSKRVHARQMGSGGIVYAIDTDYLYVTPTPGDNPSPTPWPSPTPEPPSATPTPGATETPSASPTFPPSCTPTPVPTIPTEPFFRLTLNAHEFTGGDVMIVTLDLTNETATEVTVDVYILLYVSPETYLFLTLEDPYPTFSPELTPLTLPLPSGFTVTAPILTLPLPEIAGIYVEGAWYGVMAAAGTFNFIGDLSYEAFTYGDSK